MDYEKAKSYWDLKDKENKKMEREELLTWMDEFLSSHNTLALATSDGTYIDCTPLEYNYKNRCIYIFTEGGHKFIGLEKNKNVSASVFESYTGFGKINSMQIYGTSTLVEPKTEEYYSLMDMKRIPREKADKLSLYLLRIDFNRIQILCSEFGKRGYSSRQVIEFVPDEKKNIIG